MIESNPMYPVANGIEETGNNGECFHPLLPANLTKNL